MRLGELCMFLAATIAVMTGGLALAAGPVGEDCPQGLQIRAQKTYPPKMSDCEVLDADTAVENRKSRGVPASIPPPANRPSRTSEMKFSQQAVLYDEDPNSPQGRSYVGTVNWRTEPIRGDAGQAAGVAVRADIDIPERKLKMTMSFRRNTDTSLPASHTVDISFVLPQDFASGGISTVPGILMKSKEQARGTPLAALAVKVTGTLFTIGLPTDAAMRTRNLALLNERPWFDIPIVYNNGRRAIITFKKGDSGQRAFDQAFTAWNEETRPQQIATESVATQRAMDIAGRTSPSAGTLLSTTNSEPLDGAKQRLGDALREKSTRKAVADDSVTIQMERVDRLFWLAFNASICQLRSNTWFGNIRTSWDTWSDKKIKESGTTYKQANDLSQRVRGQVEAEFGGFPAICQRLRNSLIMDELDAMETRITGNYH
jgi:hypothetical protein